MTDPLRPAVSLIESIARKSAVSESKPSDQKTPTPLSTSKQLKNTTTPLTFTTKLRARLSGIDKGDRPQLRKAFVEISLLSELGEQLILDPGFSALIERVSEIIATDEAAIISLDRALQELLPK